MPQRATFRDPVTGRFVSEAAAGQLENAVRSVYEDGELVSEQVLRFGQVEDESVGTVQNWQEEESKWGQRWFADDEPLDLYGLRQTEFPEDFDSYRVTYHVADNPDYPRKYASTDWFMPDQWPPDLGALRNVAATGIAQIVFRRS